MKHSLLLLTMLWPAANAAARDVSVTVTEPGTLRECIASVTDNFESITRLTVRGPLDPDTDNDVYYYLTNLEELDLSGAELVEFSGAMFMNALRSVKLPASTKHIPMTGFYTCPNLTTIEMPGVETMEQMSIAGCPALKELHLPATLVSAFGAVFGCTGLTDVYHTAFLPVKRVVNIEEGETQTITHHVPAASFDLYAQVFESDNHATLVAYDVRFTLLNIYDDATLSNTSAMEGADVRLSVQEDNASWLSSGYNCGALTVASGAPWSVGNFSMACEPHSTYVGYPDYDSEYYACMTRLLVDGTPMTASGDVTVELTESGETEQWTFFALPFDTRLSDLEAGPSRYVVRRFDASARAEGGEAWVNVGPNETLKAHEGYIITREHSDYYYKDDEDDYDDYDDYGDDDEFVDDYSPFVFHAADTPAKQDIFASGAVEYELQQHPAKQPHMAHWNFVGNPYPCFYSIGGIRENYNILIYHDWTYVALNTQDAPDSFLAPFQPFFVQTMPGSEVMHFAPSARFADDRAIKLPEYSQRRTAAQAASYGAQPTADAQAPRRVLNLLLTDAGDEASAQRSRTDRARLVVNPAATTAYEINRDAAKMMSPRSDVPQIFISENGMRLAIDERPVTPGTTLDLGLQVGSEREQCISLEAHSSSLDACSSSLDACSSGLDACSSGLDAHSSSLDACEDGLSVFLTDRLTGDVVDLTVADYRFTALPGLIAGRFTITVGAAPEGLVAIGQESAAGAQRFDLQGRPLTKSAGAAISIEAGRKLIK